MLRTLNRHAFTLIELLVVVSALGLLGYMGTVAIGNEVKKAQGKAGAEHLREIQAAKIEWLSRNPEAQSAFDSMTESQRKAAIAPYLKAGFPVPPADGVVYLVNDINSVPTASVNGDSSYEVHIPGQTAAANNGIWDIPPMRTLTYQALAAPVTPTTQDVTLTVSVSPPGAAAMPLGGGTFPSGSTRQIRAMPGNDGYAFIGWSGDHSGSTSPDTIVVNSDMAIVANYAQVVKTGPAQVQNGSEGDFVVTVRNNSALNLASATMTDDLPAQTSYVSHSSTGPGTVSVAGSMVTWQGPLSIGEEAVITIRFRMNNIGLVTNQASFLGATADHTVEGTAGPGDVIITKNVAGSPYDTDQTFEFALTPTGGGTATTGSIDILAGDTTGSTTLSVLEGEYVVAETSTHQNTTTAITESSGTVDDGVVSVTAGGTQAVTVTNTYTPPAGSIRIIKFAQGDPYPYNQQFDFTAQLNGSGATYSGSVVLSEGTGMANTTISDVPVGYYQVTETAPDSYTVTTFEETSGPTPNDGWIQVDSGATTVIVVTNTRTVPPINISLSKILAGDPYEGGEIFTFRITGPNGRTDFNTTVQFQVNPDGTTVTPIGSPTITVPEAGIYSIVEENVPAGTVVSGTGDIDVAVGGTFTPTFTNTYTRTHTLTVLASPPNAVQWLPPVATYDYGEIVSVSPPEADYDDGDRSYAYVFVGWTGDITPTDTTDGSESVTMTRDRVITANYVRLTKASDGASLFVGIPDTYRLTINNLSNISVAGTLSDPLPVGTTLNSASATSGSVSTGANEVSWSGNIPIHASSLEGIEIVINHTPNVTGTLTNWVTLIGPMSGLSAIARARNTVLAAPNGTVNVTKTITGTNYPSPESFTIEAVNQSTADTYTHTFSLSSGSSTHSFSLPPGTYRISETTVPPDTSVSYSESPATGSSTDGLVTIASYETVNVTVTNNYAPGGSLTINKAITDLTYPPGTVLTLNVTGPNGFDQDITFDHTGAPTPAGSNIFTGIDPGTYTITEPSPPANTVVSGSGGTVSVTPLGTHSYTVTNDYNPVGTLQVRKQVSGVNYPGTPTFVVDVIEQPSGTVVHTFNFTNTSGTSAYSSAQLPILGPGEYYQIVESSITPASLAGDTTTTIIESSATANDGNILLTDGATVQATVNNLYQPAPTLTIAVTISNTSAPFPSGQDFISTLTNTGTGAVQSHTWDVDSGSGTSVTTTPVTLTLAPGTYTFAESRTNLPPGTVVSGERTAGNEITLSYGDSATATIINHLALDYELQVLVKPAGAATPVGSTTAVEGSTLTAGYENVQPGYMFIGWTSSPNVVATRGYAQDSTSTSDAWSGADNDISGIRMSQDKTFTANFIRLTHEIANDHLDHDEETIISYRLENYSDLDFDADFSDDIVAKFPQNPDFDGSGTVDVLYRDTGFSVENEGTTSIPSGRWSMNAFNRKWIAEPSSDFTLFRNSSTGIDFAVKGWHPTYEWDAASSTWSDGSGPGDSRTHDASYNGLSVPITYRVRPPQFSPVLLHTGYSSTGSYHGGNGAANTRLFTGASSSVDDYLETGATNPSAELTAVDLPPSGFTPPQVGAPYNYLAAFRFPFVLPDHNSIHLPLPSGFVGEMVATSDAGGNASSYDTVRNDIFSGPIDVDISELGTEGYVQVVGRIVTTGTKTNTASFPGGGISNTVSVTPDTNTPPSPSISKDVRSINGTIYGGPITPSLNADGENEYYFYGNGSEFFYRLTVNNESSLRRYVMVRDVFDPQLECIYLADAYGGTGTNEIILDRTNESTVEDEYGFPSNPRMFGNARAWISDNKEFIALRVLTENTVLAAGGETYPAGHPYEGQPVKVLDYDGDGEVTGGELEDVGKVEFVAIIELDATQDEVEIVIPMRFRRDVATGGENHYDSGTLIPNYATVHDFGPNDPIESNTVWVSNDFGIWEQTVAATQWENPNDPLNNNVRAKWVEGTPTAEVQRMNRPGSPDHARGYISYILSITNNSGTRFDAVVRNLFPPGLTWATSGIDGLGNSLRPVEAYRQDVGSSSVTRSTNNYSSGAQIGAGGIPYLMYTIPIGANRTIHIQCNLICDYYDGDQVIPYTNGRTFDENGNISADGTPSLWWHDDDASELLDYDQEDQGFANLFNQVTANVMPITGTAASDSFTFYWRKAVTNADTTSKKVSGKRTFAGDPIRNWENKGGVSTLPLNADWRSVSSSGDRGGAIFNQFRDALRSRYQRDAIVSVINNANESTSFNLGRQLQPWVYTSTTGNNNGRHDFTVINIRSYKLQSSNTWLYELDRMMVFRDGRFVGWTPKDRVGSVVTKSWLEAHSDGDPIPDTMSYHNSANLPQNYPNGAVLGGYFFHSYWEAAPTPEGVSSYVTPLVIGKEGETAPDTLAGHWEISDRSEPVPDAMRLIDLDGTGEKWWEWIGPTADLLVYDPNDDITKVSGYHLFGTVFNGKSWKDGYEALASLDTNGDDKISGNELVGIKLWTDANSNARIDGGEMRPISESGIVSLDTVPTRSGQNAWHTNGAATYKDGSFSFRPTWDWWGLGGISPEVWGGGPAMQEKPAIFRWSPLLGQNIPEELTGGYLAFMKVGSKLILSACSDVLLPDGNVAVVTFPVEREGNVFTWKSGNGESAVVNVAEFFDNFTAVVGRTESENLSYDWGATLKQGNAGILVD